MKVLHLDVPLSHSNQPRLRLLRGAGVQDQLREANEHDNIEQCTYVRLVNAEGATPNVFMRTLLARDEHQWYTCPGTSEPKHEQKAREV